MADFFRVVDCVRRKTPALEVVAPAARLWERATGGAVVPVFFDLEDAVGAVNDAGNRTGLVGDFGLGFTKALGEPSLALSVTAGDLLVASDKDDLLGFFSGVFDKGGAVLLGAVCFGMAAFGVVGALAFGGDFVDAAVVLLAEMVAGAAFVVDEVEDVSFTADLAMPGAAGLELFSLIPFGPLPLLVSTAAGLRVVVRLSVAVFVGDVLPLAGFVLVAGFAFAGVPFDFASGLFSTSASGVPLLFVSSFFSTSTARVCAGVSNAASGIESVMTVLFSLASNSFVIDCLLSAIS